MTAITGLIPKHWPGPLRDLVLMAFGLLVLILGVVFLAGVFLMAEALWGAIHAEGEARAGSARLSMLIFAGLLGAPFVLWRALIASKQVTINQESHYTALFTKAVEQLGADKTVWKDATRADDTSERIQTTERNIEVRLGAIYALERVMQDSARDAGPIVETLSAYVRENCGEPVEKPEDGAEGAWPKRADFGVHYSWRVALRAHLRTARGGGKPPADFADVLAALTVLGRRQGHALIDAQGEKIRSALSAANLQAGALSGAGLEGADLSFARLEGADLFGAGLRSDYSKITYHPEEFAEQIAEAFGHKADTTLPEGIAVPEHWSEAGDWGDFYAEWIAYKKSLSLT